MALTNADTVRVVLVLFQDNLAVKCDIKDPTGCTEKEAKYIETMSAKDKDAVNKELDRLKGMTVRCCAMLLEWDDKTDACGAATVWFNEARAQAVAVAAAEHLGAAQVGHAASGGLGKTSLAREERHLTAGRLDVATQHCKTQARTLHVLAANGASLALSLPSRPTTPRSRVCTFSKRAGYLFVCETEHMQ